MTRTCDLRFRKPPASRQFTRRLLKPLVQGDVQLFQCDRSSRCVLDGPLKSVGCRARIDKVRPGPPGFLVALACPQRCQFDGEGHSPEPTGYQGRCEIEAA